MTQRRALGDLDVDSTFDDLDNGWFGYVPAVDPASSREPEDAANLAPEADWYDVGGAGTEDTDRWPALTLDAPAAPRVDEVPRPAEPETYQLETYLAETYQPESSEPRVDAPDARPMLEPRVDTWVEAPPAISPSWESRLSGSGAWDFKVMESGPRDRSTLAVVGLVVAGLAVAGVVLLVRSTGPADDGSPGIAPSPPTAQPAPTSAAPTSTAPALLPNEALLPSPGPLPPGPPPPQPPPPPSAQEISPPVVTRNYPPRQQNPPADSAKPEIGVTRSPATRTQMSAKPPPPREVPNHNSGTPGDTRGGFGFGGF